MENLAYGPRIIHVKFQSPKITGTAVIGNYSKNSEKFEVQYSNFRIVENLAYGQRIVQVKIQSPVITGTAVICKNSKNSEKFELRISNIWIVEDTMAPLVIIHAKY